MLFLGTSDPVRIFLTTLIVFSISCYLAGALYAYFRSVLERRREKRRTLRESSAAVQVVPVPLDRRNSTVLHAESLHAEHLEHERRLHEKHAQRAEKQRRRTEQRVKARAQLRQSKALSRVEMFQHLDSDVISQLIEKMTYESPSSGTKIVKENDVADSLYVIMKGQCGVYQQEAGGSSADPMDSPGKKKGVLSDLDVFGESALVDDSSSGARRRNATVIVESERAQLLKLSREDFEAMFASEQQRKEDVLGRARTVRLSRIRSNASMEGQGDPPTEPPPGPPPEPPPSNRVTRGISL